MLRVLILLFSLLVFSDSDASRYSGAAWEATTCNYYNGAAWVACTGHRYSGATWETLGVAGEYFIFTVQTTGASDTFALPLISGGTYNFTVDWGDGSSDTITTYNHADVTHTYAAEGLYTVTISGQLWGWSFNNGGSKDKIRTISNWGTDVFRFGNTTGHFYGCSGLLITATGAPNITGTTSLLNAFRACSSVTTMDLALLDVSSVVAFSGAFRGMTALTSMGDISGWTLTSAVGFSETWRDSVALTTLGDLSGWTVGTSVNNFYRTFYGTTALGTIGDISGWNVSSVTNMNGMFDGANSALTDFNYSKLLIEWVKLSLQTGVLAHFGDAEYYIGTSTTARGTLTNAAGLNWTVTDGGQSATETWVD